LRNVIGYSTSYFVKVYYIYMYVIAKCCIKAFIKNSRQSIESLVQWNNALNFNDILNYAKAIYSTVKIFRTSPQTMFTLNIATQTVNTKFCHFKFFIWPYSYFNYLIFINQFSLSLLFYDICIIIDTFVIISILRKY